jgi:hypothetical protein
LAGLGPSLSLFTASIACSRGGAWSALAASFCALREGKAIDRKSDLKARAGALLAGWDHRSDEGREISTLRGDAVSTLWIGERMNSRPYMPLD